MDHLSDDDDSTDYDNAVTNNSAGGGGGGDGFHSIRDRFRFKRNPNSSSKLTPSVGLDRQSKPSRSHLHHHHHHNRSWTRRVLLLPFRERSRLFFWIISVIFLFALASLVLQSSIMAVFSSNGGDGSETSKWRWFAKEELKVGSSLFFVPSGKLLSGIDRLRQEHRIGVRPPRIGLILGNMDKDPSSLMLSTVMNALKGLGYVVKIYAHLDGEARIVWEEIGGSIHMLNLEDGPIDWATFEGVIAYSIEAHDAVYSLMQEPFCSVPLIWVIHEDTLANRLQAYEDMHWEHIKSHWRSTFRRADVVVFPDYSLPMLYSELDTGNFLVVPGSPVDVWVAESYTTAHSKILLREENGFDRNDLLVLVVGSLFSYKGLSLDRNVRMDVLEPLLVKYAGKEEAQKTFKFVFLCSISSSGSDEFLQDVAARLRLPHGSLRHYGVDSDVNGVILMSDIVLYASSQDEQGFPPFLTRAMSFGIPIVAPDYPVIGRYVSNGVQGMIYQKNIPEELMKSFALLVTEGELSELSHAIASSGRELAKNMLASECMMTYAELLENVFNFPSDVLLPGDTSKLTQSSWEWNLYHRESGREISHMEENRHIRLSNLVNVSVVHAIEEDMANLVTKKDASGVESEALKADYPTNLDWEIVTNMERLEETEKLEVEEIEERMEKDIGNWTDLYRNARKAEKIQFEAYERDEGELERTGEPVCIYETYDGAGAWEFLHHGSLYRGLSLSSSALRLRSDDVDAVSRLSLLNDTYYRNVLCEIGGMFAIANMIDDIHNRPWIGFQSWRASGRKVALSSQAELVLEDVIHESTKGDIIYFWAKLDIGGGLVEKNDVLTFWSMCDILNGGNCRTIFEDAFRQMYALPSHVDSLPPMPEDGGHWSALHSWVMPTRSFLEFIMFSRMFVDSLNLLHTNSSISHCLLASSMLEERHCYCRVLEILVNVWAYHSARRMVYIDPQTGLLEEQHPIEQRKEFMWVKYFDFTTLKSMDEDLAEAADDDHYPYESWLWPLTGEVYWQGIYERQREDRYRLKMEKKRRNKEKLLDRMKYGYKQKTLGRR